MPRASTDKRLHNASDGQTDKQTIVPVIAPQGGAAACSPGASPDPRGLRGKFTCKRGRMNCVQKLSLNCDFIYQAKLLIQCRDL